GSLDVMTVHAGLNGNNWELSNLPGNNDGTFGGETRFTIGTTQPPNPNLVDLTSTPTDLVAVNSTTPFSRSSGTIAATSSDIIFSDSFRMLYIQNISATTPGNLNLRRPPVGPNNAEDGLFGNGGNSIEMDDNNLAAARFSS